MAEYELLDMQNYIKSGITHADRFCPELRHIFEKAAFDIVSSVDSEAYDCYSSADYKTAEEKWTAVFEYLGTVGVRYPDINFVLLHNILVCDDKLGEYEHVKDLLSDLRRLEEDSKDSFSPKNLPVRYVEPDYCFVAETLDEDYFEYPGVRMDGYIRKDEDHIYFGRYPQTENGRRKRIEWTILKEEDGKALLLSSFVLDNLLFHSDRREVTWSKCMLRRWLNTLFYRNAFGLEEMKRIVEVAVNGDETSFDISGHAGEKITDRVFLLSPYEVEKYDKEKGIGYSYWTDYAKCILKQSRGGGFWLRDSGSDFESTCALYAHSVYTTVWEHGYGRKAFVTKIDLCSVRDTQKGVRPAIWIRL